MTEERQNYEPQSDAAKFAMKGGVLWALAGAIVAAEQTVALGVETLRHLPHGETVANVVEAVGFTALMGAIAAKAPRRVDAFLDRQER